MKVASDACARMDAAREKALADLERAPIEPLDVLAGAGLPDARARDVLLTQLRSLF